MPEEALDAADTCAVLAAEEVSSIALVADITIRESCDDVVAQSVTALGGLDNLVNNAGYQMARDVGLAELTDERLDRVF